MGDGMGAGGTKLAVGPWWPLLPGMLNWWPPNMGITGGGLGGTLDPLLPLGVATLGERGMLARRGRGWLAGTGVGAEFWNPSLPNIFLASSIRSPPLLGLAGLTIWFVVQRMPFDTQFVQDTSGCSRTRTCRGRSGPPSLGVRRASMSHLRMWSVMVLVAC